MVMGIDLVHWRGVAPSYSLVRKPFQGVLTHRTEESVIAKINEQGKCECCQKQSQHGDNRNEHHWISTALHSDECGEVGIIPTSNVQHRGC